MNSMLNSNPVRSQFPSEPDRHALAWHIGHFWVLRKASLEEIKRLLTRVGADPAAFVKRLQKDGTTVPGRGLLDAVTRLRHSYHEGVVEFRKIKFDDPTELDDSRELKDSRELGDPKDLDDPIIATAFVEGVLAGWREAKAAVPV